MQNTHLNILTVREKEIIAEVSKGLFDKEIAHKICVSPETVKKHVKNIYKKLGVRNRVEASVLYMFNLQSIA
jgi:DNA-binding NarL/FixJ family response regulator